jgi:1,4-dihydroxy-2-naphthoyl-CoA synthase
MSTPFRGLARSTVAGRIRHANLDHGQRHAGADGDFTEGNRAMPGNVETDKSGVSALASLKNVKVELDDGIAWITLSRPEKRNAMNPDLNDEMVRVLDILEIEPSAKVLVLTGAGDSFSAGMDLREYFRALDKLPYDQQMQRRRSAWNWQWRMLLNYSKPTIAMVNGWCFGGAFTPLVA